MMPLSLHIMAHYMKESNPMILQKRNIPILDPENDSRSDE